MSLIQRWAALYPCQILVVISLPLLYGPDFVRWLWLATVVLSGLYLAVHPIGRLQTGRWAGLLLVAAALSGLYGLRGLSLERPSVWPQTGQLCWGTGIVLSENPPGAYGERRFLFQLERIENAELQLDQVARVHVQGYRGPPPALGQRLSWRGRLSATGVLDWQTGALIGWDQPWAAWRADARRSLEARFAVLSAGTGALAEALILGAVDNLTTTEKLAFRQVGCSHVLALSGMHLSLLALILHVLLRRWFPPWLGFGLIQLVLAGFCWLAGPLPSLYRAWLMALVLGWGQLRKIPLDAAETVALSYWGVILLWPEMAGSLSLQLSVLALWGIVRWSRIWELRLRPSLGGTLASILAPSLAACVATWPLTVPLSGGWAWIGLILSPPLVLLTNGLIAGALVFLVVGGWWPGPVLAQALELLYQLIFRLLAWGGQAPTLPAEALGLGCLLGGLGAGGVFLYNRSSRCVVRGYTMPVALNYDSPSDLQAFLESRGFNPLKRWGQNYLINSGARRQILDALELEAGETVWEIGPGLGALTHQLVAQAHPLTVFEIDPGYSVFLREEFASAPAGFALVEGDVIKTWRGAAANQPPCKTVGNLPYNAASAIIADFVEGGWFPPVFVVTVQKEMAQRMTAAIGSKNYSSFSILCQSAFRLKDIVSLRPGSFYPSPEVTSQVVQLKPHGLYPGLDHRRFSVFVRECFSSRRKTLRNNLPGAAAALRLSDAAVVSSFQRQGIELTRRAETLSVAEWVAVFQRATGALSGLDQSIPT